MKLFINTWTEGFWPLLYLSCGAEMMQWIPSTTIRWILLTTVSMKATVNVPQFCKINCCNIFLFQFIYFQHLMSQTIWIQNTQFYRLQYNKFYFELVPLIEWSKKLSKNNFWMWLKFYFSEESIKLYGISWQTSSHFVCLQPKWFWQMIPFISARNRTPSCYI